MNVDYINTLGAGSGLNTKEIVSALVTAEQAPEEARLNRKISESELEITALGLAKSSFSDLQAAASLLNDKSDFEAFSISNSQPTAFSALAGVGALAGSHSVTVSSVANEQRTNLMPNGATEFSSSSQLLNSGTSFDLTLTIGNASTVDHTIAVTTTTPQGIVDAINAADLDVSASLIDKGTSGTDYIIQLVGASGTENQFTVTPSVSNMLASDTPSGSTAANAALTVNGVTYSRSSNVITDIIPGVTLNINSVTSGAASLSVSQDTSSVETNIRNLVETYNTAKTAINDLTSREIEGALAGDSVFRQTVRSLTNVLIGASSTPGSQITRLSDLGITINRTGFLEIDDTDLANGLSSNFDDLRKMFSADTDSQIATGEAARGVAGDLSKLIDDLTGSSGYIDRRETQLDSDITSYEDELDDLEERMESLRARYEKQFASMNALVDSLNNTKDGLVSSFENLPFTNKD